MEPELIYFMLFAAFVGIFFVLQSRFRNVVLTGGWMLSLLIAYTHIRPTIAALTARGQFQPEWFAAGAAVVSVLIGTLIGNAIASRIKRST